MRTLTDLTQLCSKETEHFFHHRAYDPRHCFELFRRAILEGEQDAWEAVYSQYGPLVARWVAEHPGFEGGDEEVQYFVNRAFEKIWAALSPDIFRAFTELGSLLRYLKMCVHSVIADYNRACKLAEQTALVEEFAFEKAESSPSVEERALDQAYRQDFWNTINAHLYDEKERRVVYGSFVLGLKPQELYDHFRNVFTSVEEIYLIKQNVLARLRRDPQLHHLL